MDASKNRYSTPSRYTHTLPIYNEYRDDVISPHEIDSIPRHPTDTEYTFHALELLTESLQHVLFYRGDVFGCHLVRMRADDQLMMGW